MAMPARRLVSRVGRSLSPSPALLSCFGRSVGSPVRHNKLEHRHASPVRHLISGTGYSYTHKGVPQSPYTPPPPKRRPAILVNRLLIVSYLLSESAKDVQLALLRSLHRKSLRQTRRHYTLLRHGLWLVVSR